MDMCLSGAVSVLEIVTSNEVPIIYKKKLDKFFIPKCLLFGVV
jgi:hypothetical protein